MLLFCNTVFLQMFEVHCKIKKKTQETSRVAPVPHSHSFPHYQHHTSKRYTCYNWRPTRTCQNHPKSIVYVRVHSWWCSVCRFGQMYHDMCWHVTPLWHHTEYFHCSGHPLSSSYSSPLLPPSLHILSHYCFSPSLHSFAVSRILYNGNHTVCWLFRLYSFT